MSQVKAATKKKSFHIKNISMWTWMGMTVLLVFIGAMFVIVPALFDAFANQSVPLGTPTETTTATGTDDNSDTSSTYLLYAMCAVILLSLGGYSFGRK